MCKHRKKETARTQKRKAQSAIEKLEKEVNEGHQEALVELREQKKAPSKIEDKEIEEAEVFRKKKRKALESLYTTK